MSADVVSIAVRAAAFLLVLQSIGLAIFLLVFPVGPSGGAAGLRRLGWWSALAAIGLVLTHQLLEGARMADAWGGLINPSLQRLSLQTSAGVSLGMQFVGLGVLALALRPGGRWTGEPGLTGALAAVATLVVLASFAATGHTIQMPHRAFLAGVLVVHLAVAAFWIGSLRALLHLSRRLPPPELASLVALFSRRAVWLVPGVAVAGTVLAWSLLPGLAALGRPYGRLLVVKAAIFTLLMGLAALNKWRFGPWIARDGTAVRPFRFTVLAEYALICVVLAATAVLTTLYSPEGE